ncbi:MAG TPA: hypothetical protein VFO85_08370, partial [Vicinamibacteria bacterium]|nr:hypothetical protein [Vicinamibacteria bacterium]
MKPLLAVPVLPLVLGAAALAGAQTRPLQTEEAATARAGTLVLEAGADVMLDEPNFLTGGERTRLDAPVLRLVWSPADTVEVDVEWTARVAALDDPDFGTVSDWGDVALRAKMQLRDGSDGLGVAARFGVTLPQTSFGNGLGPNALRMSAQLLVSLCEGACVHANAGLAIHDEVDRPHEQRDFLHYGLAVVAPAEGTLSVVAELAGLAGRGAPGA